MKKAALVAVLVAGALLFTFANDAGAACSIGGKVLYLYSDSSITYVYIGYGIAAIDIVHYFVVGNSDFAMVNLLQNGQAGRLWVTANGNAVACPSVGVYRYGGALTSVTSIMNY